MNRTALSVIALAVGSVLIIGLFNIYKPQTKRLAKKVFHKPQVALENSYMNAPKKGTPVTNKVKYVYRGKIVGFDPYPALSIKGKFGEKNTINWTDDGFLHMPNNWNPGKDTDTDFLMKPNGDTQYINIQPNPIPFNISYVDSSNHTVGSHTYIKPDRLAYNHASSEAKSAFTPDDLDINLNSTSPGLPNGYHIVSGQQTKIPTYSTKADYTLHVAK